MSDTAEYDRLVSDKANAQNQLSDAVRERDQIQDKIDRLKAAKRTLSDEYNSFHDVKRIVEGAVRQDYEWKGGTYDQFYGCGSALVNANQVYYGNLDDARDEINLEIMRLENRLYEQEGILGQLRSLINSLAHKIENYFND